MDSVTQLALGASIGVAVMGRRTCVWKAAVWGGVAGTLPDLDVFIDYGDAVLNMVLHRAHSHALWWTAVAGLLMGAGVARLHGQEHLTQRWSLAMMAALVTHPLLDVLTIYGTQLLQPWSDEALGVGSIFIIDPLYTLPLLVGLMLALWCPIAGLRWNSVLLGLSTAYLGWSLLAQTWATQHFESALLQQGLQARALMVTPAPFNTVLWRAVAVDGPHYYEGFYSLLDGGRPVRWQRFDRGQTLLEVHASHPHVQRMVRFTDGLVRMRELDGQLWLTDLRMGQEGAYVFDFRLGPALASGQSPPAATRHTVRGPIGPGLQWLWHRILGHDLPSPTAPPPV